MDSSRGRGTFRGRGIPLTTNVPKALRRPGNYSNAVTKEDLSQVNNVDKMLNQMENLLSQMKLQDHEDNLLDCVNYIKASCISSNHINSVVNSIYRFSLQSKENAHIGALICKSLGDFEVDGTKFRPLLLRRIQHDYEERKQNQENTEKFVINVTFLSEIFLSLRLPNGKCYDFLTSPVVEYFSMLLDGKTDLEIESFSELITKCHADLVCHQPSAVEDLLQKMRRRIIEGILATKARTVLLETLETIITSPVLHDAKK